MFDSMEKQRGIAWIAKAKLEIEWRMPEEWLGHSAVQTGLFDREGGKWRNACAPARTGENRKIGATNKPRQ